MVALFRMPDLLKLSETAFRAAEKITLRLIRRMIRSSRIQRNACQCLLFYKHSGRVPRYLLFLPRVFQLSPAKCFCIFNYMELYNLRREDFCPTAK